MIKKYSKIALIIVLVALLAVSLSACGLFEGINKINKVSISQKGTFIDSDNDGIIEAERGKVVHLEVAWDNSKIKSPTIQWYIQEDGKEKTAISGATTKELKYPVDRKSTIVYTVSAVVNDVESKNHFKFIVVDAELDPPTITCITPGLVLRQGVVQQNILDGLKNVQLKADSNFDDIDSSIVVNFEWKVGDVVDATATTNTFTYDVSLIEDACNTSITCTLSYEGITSPKYSSIVLDFVKEYKEVKSVEVSTTIEKVPNTKATYFNESTYSDPGTVSLTSIVNPTVGTDLSSNCVWTKEDVSGKTTLAETERTIEANLSYGKNVFTATIDNVESKQIIVYSFERTELTKNGTYIKDTFIWEGGEQDHYINNQTDLNCLVGYIVSTHSVSDSHSIYIAKSAWKDGTNATDEFKKALSLASSTGVDESGSFSFSYTAEHISLSSDSKLGEPSGACTTTYDVTQAKVYVRYSENSTKRDNLPVDFFKETMNVENSNQLYRAVYWGYKPIISPSNTELTALYNEAKDVLKTYVKEDMTDLEKVKAINDWIVSNVEYDQAALSSKDENRTNFNAFYLEGVFNDHRAVCDGKSKAFTLLCGMEGIKATRIMGYADKNLSDMMNDWQAGNYSEKEMNYSNDPKVTLGLIQTIPATEYQMAKLMGAHGFGHAWNKVLVDADGDKVKEWYVVDTTWGDVASIDGYDVTEYLTFDYLLKTDSDIASNHYSLQEQKIANTTYDPYENEQLVINEETFDFNIENATEFSKAIDYCKANKGTYLLLKIADTLVFTLEHTSGIAYIKFTTSGPDIYYVLAMA